LERGIELFGKAVSVIIMMMLLVGILSVAFNAKPAKSDYTWTQTIYIQADGSIQPPTAPISSSDNVTYTLTDNITGVPNDSVAIMILRNNIALNGAGHTLQGTNATGSCGIFTDGSNILIENMQVTAFWYGIYLLSASTVGIDGNNITANSAYGIYLNSSSNNNFSGNDVVGNSNTGIWLSSSNNNKVLGNKLLNNTYGIGLESSSYSNVTGNNVTANSVCGVWVDNYSSYNNIVGNNVSANGWDGIDLACPLANSTFVGNSTSSTNSAVGNNVSANGWDGIDVGFSSNNSLSGNYIAANGWDGIGLYLNSSYDNVVGNNITANIVNGIEFQSSSNNSVSGNNITANGYNGLWLASSSNNGVSGNNITANNETGIGLDSFSNDNSVSGNNVTANIWSGIKLSYYSNNNGVSGNNVTANSLDGIKLESSSNNSLIGNNITANSLAGIGLDSSSNNTIYHNNFMNNTSQTSSSGSTNVWDNGYPSGGNYWSDYAGTDLYSGPYQNTVGSDGIGDTPYAINGNNTDQDHYPLMQPYSSVEMSVFCSPNPVSRGSPVTCTAVASGFNPTGTITWSTSSPTGYFNQSICNLSNGACSTIYIDNSSGSITIAGYYSGDSNNVPNSGSTILTVASDVSDVYYSKNYTSVQAAINAAPPGATVIITPGFYSESLIVNKTLTIIGDKDTPVFSGGGSGVCITLLAGASGSVVTGIMITAFNEGVSVVNASNCGIYCNIFASLGDTGIGIEGSTATSNAIYDNLFQDTPTPIKLTTSTVSNNIYGNMINSQATVTLNVGANGNNVYENVVSANQIVLNVANSNAIYHNDFLASAQITVSETGTNIWDDGYPAGGNYWSTYHGVDQEHGPYQNLTGPDGIGDTPYVIATGSTDRYPLMKPWTTTAGHSVAVMSVITAKTQIGQGFNCNVTLVVADDGEYAETFSTTWYANDKTLGTRQVNNLQAMCPLILTFMWNTTGVAYGNYTLSAYAWPVPGETDVADNNFTGGTVKVTIPGDINGDFTVDIYDAILLAGAFNTNANSPHWNPNADINGDNTVDIYDAIILAVHFNQHYP